MKQRENDRNDVVRFPFRPWVRRAGLSIIFVAAGVTVALLVFLFTSRGGRFGWAAEGAVWIYVVAIWAAGLKVFLGTLWPVAEVEAKGVIVRPLHQLRARTIRWERVRGTEQMIGGDRLIIYYDTPRGLRFVALNLNLVKGRRDFLALLDERLRAMRFGEKVVERSRYLTREGAAG